MSLLLSGMAAIVLLVACLNLANMLLARGSARRQEIAIRQSLGGGRGRIVRQLLTEGLLLSLAGSVIGLLVARWVINLLFASVTPVLPFAVTLPELAVDGRVLVATLGFSVMATLFFALGPAWKLARHDLVGDLNQRVGGTGWWSLVFAGRNVLVVGQLALSLALLTAGGLFLRGALTAGDRDPGFSLDHGLLAETDPSLIGYDEARGRQVYDGLLERIRAVPGSRRPPRRHSCPTAGPPRDGASSPSVDRTPRATASRRASTS